MKLTLGTKSMLTTALSHQLSKREPRNYLGVSQLGIECDRQLYYKYHKPDLDVIKEPRIQSIFAFGFLVEKYILGLLIESGLEVFDVDEEGKQFEVVYEDKIKGHIDAVIKGIPESTKPHLLEIKSMNDSNFKRLEKEGLEHGFHEYYIQMICYIFLFKLENGLFIAMNKNDCNIYTERIKSDNIVAESYLKRGLEIVNTKELPDRKYKDKHFFKCRMCNFAEECWKES